MLSIPLFVLLFHSLSSSLVDVATQQIQSIYNVKKSFVGVIDAGSTGTRLNIYAFFQPGNILAYSSTKKSFPGLQKLEDDEIDAVINYLLEDASIKMRNENVELKDMVFTAQGTAGMRALRESDQKRIIKVINDHFERKNLKLRHPEVISGIREGFLALSSLGMLMDYKRNILSTFGCKDKMVREHIKKVSPRYCNTTEKEVKYKGILDMGGGSIQVVYEFDKDDKYNDPAHTIHTIGKNIYINSFPGWGLKEGMMVLKENENYKLETDNGREDTMFDRLLRDFSVNHKPDINKVDGLYLTSYFYDKFKKLGCQTESSLKEVSDLYKKHCGKTDQFCKEVYYMYKFLEAQGLKADKSFYLVGDVAGVSLSWSLSSALMLATEPKDYRIN